MTTIYKTNKYRVVAKKYDNLMRGYYIIGYKVQVKVLFFWITIKEFKEYEYDDSVCFCKQEAIELYDKIVNPYGKL